MITNPSRAAVMAAGLLVSTIAAPSSALAWGAQGHEVIALIAEAHMTPKARERAQALLAADEDARRGESLATAATWADRYRASHRETAGWHFADLEIDGSNDLAAACERGCVVERLEHFEAELADSRTVPEERVTALKFVLHLTGDLHQPLHVADNHDRGGNCVAVRSGGGSDNLHAYWDDETVRSLGPDASLLARSLDQAITPQQAVQWRRGDAVSWAMETHQVARRVSYALPTDPGCRRDVAVVAITPAYDRAARAAARLQLQRAGIRLARLLNEALDR